MEKVFAVVSGNMGVGKSTLVEKLAAKLGWKAVFEPQDENPYLADFYQDMERWALPSQCFFLGRRLKQYREIMAGPQNALQDRCVYEDANVFARNLHEQGKIPERDWRGEYERQIPLDYLRGLQRLYENWIQNYRLSPVLVVTTDGLDFVKEEGHLELVAQKVMDKLSGHETLDFSSP